MNILYHMEDNTIRLRDADGEVLTLCEEPRETDVIITLAGNLRSDVVLYLQDELEAFLSLGQNVIVDLSGLHYVSAAAQRVFLQVQQQINQTCRGSLKLSQLTDAVYTEFVQTGASELLIIERGGT